ncbi:DUF5615 family PIN-like protein [Candidatus Thiosymbion oneisti]|uniref:DUF5615 family PIN-like protein n=1 Tax=Candidatus Thiosymbion oneisti TaxID=589554 RepID=UPI000AB4CD03
MKLLFDEHLSYRLAVRLADIFPDSKHVKDSNLQTKDDLRIWEFAKEHEFVIVTKDSDFIDITNVRGYPPYLIWIRSGNVRVSDIEGRIRKNAIRILNSFENQIVGVIQIR